MSKKTQNLVDITLEQTQVTPMRQIIPRQKQSMLKNFNKLQGNDSELVLFQSRNKPDVTPELTKATPKQAPN